MITEDYVSFEVAKILKEKGFNEPSNHLYIEDRAKCRRKKIIFDKNNNIDWNDNNFTSTISAPTVQMVLKWLREIHHIDICVCREIDEQGKCFDGYIAVVHQNKTYKVTIRDVTKDLTYEEVTNKAIEYGLTLI